MYSRRSEGNTYFEYLEQFHKTEISTNHLTVFKLISIAKPTRCTNVLNLFYFEMTLYMFRTVFPSIIKSSRLYIQQQAFVRQTAVFVWQMPVAICTVLYSWCWTENQSETCRTSFQNKINLINLCIVLVLL